METEESGGRWKGKEVGLMEREVKKNVKESKERMEINKEMGGG